MERDKKQLCPFLRKVEELPVKLKYSRTLEYFEGLILAEYADEKGWPWVEKWCDCDNTAQRYLFVAIESPEKITSYLKKEISMLDLLTSGSSSGYIVDESGGKTTAVYYVHLDELPSGYMPSPDSFHDEDLMP